MSVRTALIVGAGIGGLAAGVALHRAGWRVRIFERAPEARALGFALSLAPNAMEALRELGLAERVLEQACIVSHAEMRNAAGDLLKRFDVAAELGQSASVFALRPALHGALLHATDPPALTLGCEAAAYEVANAGVTLTLKDGRSETGAILIGADGVGSVIRRLLRPAEGPPRRSRYIAVRGVAHNAVAHLRELSIVGYLGHGIEAATVRAGRNAVYWYISLLAEDSFLLSGGLDAVLDKCAKLLDPPFGAIVRSTEREDLRTDELFDREPIEDWGRGPVTLLGDAAHPMLPHAGQGAAQALEDAVALGIALGPGRDVISGLRSYERVRSQRTRAVVLRARRIAAVSTTKSRIVGGLRNAAIRMAPPRATAASFLLIGRSDPHRALR